MYSAARKSEELTAPGKPLTRRALHAVPESQEPAQSAPLRPRNYTSVSTPSTRRELHHSRPTPIASAHAVPESAVPDLFNVEDFGPLSPESQDLSSMQAETPLALRELSIAELMWLQEMRYHLRTPEQPALDAEQLSKVFNDFSTAWHSRSETDRWDATFSITSIGVALGDLIAQGNENCLWVAADTEKGTIFGVRAPQQRATFFPVDAVNRRWLAAHLDWIVGFVRNAHSQMSTQPTA